MKHVNRRTVLRGMMGGGAISIGLPILDCFLNDNGTALASTGSALPPVFGTWFQHLGLNPGMWEPKKVGPDYENNSQLKVLDPFRDRINIITGTKYFLDGHPLQTHESGSKVATTGDAEIGVRGRVSLDSSIADVIGARTRFRSLEVSFSGSRKSYSQRGGTSPNPSEGSPAALYARIFGAEFKDPNAENFTPDPLAMARQSVLSSVLEQLNDVSKRLGAGDRARLDEYFTSIRQVEQQIAIQLERPAPLEACTVPSAPQEASPDTVLDHAATNSTLFAHLLSHAVACGQTQVFNCMVDSLPLRNAGSAYTWHMATHEESVDQELGYQKDVFDFITWANRVFLDFLNVMNSVREGSGTLLDRSLIVWLTDHSDARVHGMEGVPVMTVGSGGGRIKTGIHVAAPGDPLTRVGLTAQQAMGVPISEWGAGSNRTARTITEIMA